MDGLVRGHELESFDGLELVSRANQAAGSSETVEARSERWSPGETTGYSVGAMPGGQRAAILYSLVATCTAHGIDPWAYLRDVRERIPTHPNRRRAELLPLEGRADRDAVVTLRIPATATADAARFLFFCPRRPLYLPGGGVHRTLTRAPSLPWRS
jgi:hypothetical protein